MSILKKIRHEINYLNLKNFINLFIFAFSIIPILLSKVFFKISKKKIWLICEDEYEARDNGYCFFKYLRLEHPEKECYYAINYQSKDFLKVKSLGNTVRYGGIIHWILYFNCQYNISTQKAGRPDSAIGYVLERLGINKNKFIFLQHGITINKAVWLFYENTKMKMFICGAKPEYDYVKKYFGYPEDNVKYLGFPRFDDYIKIDVNKKQILLMPSWREWIASKNEFSKKIENNSNFESTEYFKKYQSLINNEALIEFLEKNNLTIKFYPHRNMQKYIKSFYTKSERILIVDSKKEDIRNLLMDSAIMITDYSSVALDFAYMKKPVIFYQFDEEKFRKAQYQEGYFDYKKSGLGKVTKTENGILELLEDAFDNSFIVSKEFEIKHREFFELYDNKNSERIYEELIK